MSDVTALLGTENMGAIRSSWMWRKQLELNGARAHNKTGVQHGAKSPTVWSVQEDELLAQYPELTDHCVGRLATQLNRPPSHIRVRHPIALQQQKHKEALARRRLLIAEIARKRQHPE
ncbi:MAG TPA: hypothetical protein VIY48_02245 [Candidatus Paceibacterota bacterium]